MTSKMHRINGYMWRGRPMEADTLIQCAKCEKVHRENGGCKNVEEDEEGKSTRYEENYKE